MNDAPPLRQHALESRVGILLVNLGSPDEASPAALRRYLREFLSDPRVIEDQGLIWKFVLNAIILTTRPRRRARDYAKIWNTAENEAPLKTITRGQAQKLSAALGGSGINLKVDWAMRYGNPAIAERVAALVAEGCDRLLVVPLYPQYAAATTATVADEIFRVISRMRAQPALRLAAPYYNDPTYIGALAASIRTALEQLAFEPDVILASFHGIPKVYAEQGDPYPQQCAETVRLLRQELGYDERKLMLTFQSRFGRAEWLKPYTDETVERLARSSVRNLVAITPGFSADCLETLEEIAMENAEIFHRSGGTNFFAVPCLNDSDDGMAVIRAVVERELRGWL
ncbi:MAG: ferrochelatase [Xanthobacteraceae bacterium]|nr:ferrochelatase [Xanthobacteraceae bacterium]